MQQPNVARLRCRAKREQLARRDKPPLCARIAGVIYITIQHLAMLCISVAVGTLVLVTTLPSGMALGDICGAHLLGVVVTGAMWRALYVVYKKGKIL